MVQIYFDDKGIKYDQYAFFQYDYGRTLVIHGLTLPTNVQVHFARKHIPAEIVIGTTVDNITTVRVPASILQYPGEFNVYIYVADENIGQTYKTITFHNRAREKPADYAPPDEPNVVQQLMDKLDRIIETGIAEFEPDLNVVNGMIDAYVKANMIANNDATTLAGFAWDARRGKAIRDDLISTNLALTTINNNLVAYPLYNDGINVSTQLALDAAINNLTRFTNGSFYRFLLNVNELGLSLSGGSWYVEGFKASDDYGWQKVTGYGSPTQIKYRSKLATWGGWETK